MADARPQEEPGPQAWAMGGPCHWGLGTLGLRLLMAPKIDKGQGLPSASRGTGLTVHQWGAGGPGLGVLGTVSPWLPPCSSQAWPLSLEGRAGAPQ